MIGRNLTFENEDGTDDLRLILSPNFKTFKEPNYRFQGTNSARLCNLVRQSFSYSVPSPHRLFKNSRTGYMIHPLYIHCKKVIGNPYLLYCVGAAD
jgi:hypothetical protein